MIKKIISLFIAAPFLLWALPGVAETPESKGSTYAIEYFTVNEGTTWMFGINNDIRVSSIGDPVIGIVLSSNPDPPFYALFQGFLYSDIFAPSEGKEQYDIEAIYAQEYSGGSDILEVTWQKDADPYFYWELKGGEITILGYSIAFNELPDEFIDVTDPEYQTPDFYLADGKHIFYAVAKNTDGNFGTPGSFEVWVDGTRPQVSNTLPENGATVPQTKPLIQATLFDALSGIDIDSINFTITTELDEYEESGTYDPETGIVSFEPDINYPNGLVTVQLTVSDIAGNEAISTLWSFTIDTTVPEGWVVVNGDAAATDTNIVTLNLFASEIVTDVDEMIISNDGNFDTEVWQPYSTTVEDWLLPLIAGTRTVYVKFKDTAGNESDVYFDSIVLIISIPNTFITEAPSTITTDTSASFSYTSTLSGCLFMYKLDDTDWTELSPNSSVVFDSLSSGNHYFQVKAAFDLNNNGNIEQDEIDPSPAVVSWTIGALSATQFEPEQPIRYYKRD